MAIYKSPEDISKINKSLKSIFLAGSIEMNKAIDWQKYCEQELANDFNVLNPRREIWDNSWEQVIENSKFKEQVNWELEALEKSDVIIMFFAGGTKSPISLLEFGLYARTTKLFVVCENDFWRKGNVDIVCERYQIRQYESLEKVIKVIKCNEVNVKQIKLDGDGCSTK